MVNTTLENQNRQKGKEHPGFSPNGLGGEKGRKIPQAPDREAKLVKGVVGLLIGGIQK